MSDDDETDQLTPAPHRRRGDLSLEQRLDGLEEGQRLILDKLNGGSVLFSGQHLRIRALEVIVYSACALGLIAIVGAILFLVIKGGVAGHP